MSGEKSFFYLFINELFMDHLEIKGVKNVKNSYFYKLII